MPLRLKIPNAGRTVEVVSTERPVRPAVPISEKIAWSDSELSEMLGISIPMLKRAREELGMPFVMIGQRRLYEPGSIRQWLAKRVQALTASAGSPLAGATNFDQATAECAGIGEVE